VGSARSNMQSPFARELRLELNCTGRGTSAIQPLAENAASLLTTPYETFLRG
jgi:hypothetical protein